MMPRQNELMIVNTVIEEGPMLRAEANSAYAADDYRDKDGLVSMCANCRRTRRPGQTVWDWIPAHVASIPIKTTHGLCGPCLLIYSRL
jgi:hypothetical protein